MKLYLSATNDKGKKEGIGGNEYIKITLSNGNINIFDITFKPDADKRGLIEVMTYYDASTQTIGYCEI